MEMSSRGGPVSTEREKKGQIKLVCSQRAPLTMVCVVVAVVVGGSTPAGVK
jgi:hypothetical protein